MRVVGAGSRTVTDYSLVLKAIESSELTITELVSGGCRGVDELFETWAFRNNVPITQFLPAWKKFGTMAGPIRNAQMARYAAESGGGLIAVWDGRSSGTANMLNQARLFDLHTYVLTTVEEDDI